MEEIKELEGKISIQSPFSSGERFIEVLAESGERLCALVKGLPHYIRNGVITRVSYRPALTKKEHPLIVGYTIPGNLCS